MDEVWAKRAELIAELIAARDRDWWDEVSAIASQLHAYDYRHSLGQYAEE